MTKTLDVYLRSESVGRLVQNDHGLLLFEYDESWLNNPDAIALSCSLPLQKQQFRGKECNGFLAAFCLKNRNANRSPESSGSVSRNDYAMLEQIGGECAGAVTSSTCLNRLPTK